MDERLNIGREVRELKLGATFAPQNSQTAFHTLKYDFKPASVDLSKVANLDVSSNNQVTVTVPNLESSGVPHTVFKGNQRTYAKECLLIFDRKTGTVTLEKLNHNIQVKKTRSEPPPPAQKLAAPPPQKPENNTQRTSSKTRVSTGVRKNAIIGFVPRSSPMQQGSPSYPHKSPQSAPAWNANSGQSTLPSIPMIGMDDDIVMPQQQQQQPPQQCPPPSSLHINNQMAMSGNSLDQFHPMHQQQQQQQFNVQNSHHHHYHQQQQQQQQQFHQQQQPQHPNSNSGMGIGSGSLMGASTAAAGTAPIGGVSTLEQEIGVLSSSDSSSDSESSESGSDSDDSADNAPQKSHHHHHHQQQQQQSSHHNQPMYSNHQPRFENGSLPALLHDDLQLSESNSSDSDS